MAEEELPELIPLGQNVVEHHTPKIYKFGSDLEFQNSTWPREWFAAIKSNFKLRLQEAKNSNELHNGLFTLWHTSKVFYCISCK